MGSLRCEAPPRGAGGWDPQGHPSTGRLRPAQLAGLAFGQLASRLHFDAPLSFRGRVRCTVPRSAGDRMCFRTRIGRRFLHTLPVLCPLRSRLPPVKGALQAPPPATAPGVRTRHPSPLPPALAHSSAASGLADVPTASDRHGHVPEGPTWFLSTPACPCLAGR